MELRFAETQLLHTSQLRTSQQGNRDRQEKQDKQAQHATEQRRCRLDELAPHQEARVVCIDPETSPRLAELGFCPGSKLQLESRAPLGDPLLFELRGSLFALRSRDAKGIEVEILEA